MSEPVTNDSPLGILLMNHFSGLPLTWRDGLGRLPKFSDLDIDGR